MRRKPELRPGENPEGQKKFSDRIDNNRFGGIMRITE